MSHNLPFLALFSRTNCLPGCLDGLWKDFSHRFHVSGILGSGIMLFLEFSEKSIQEPDFREILDMFQKVDTLAFPFFL